MDITIYMDTYIRTGIWAKVPLRESEAVSAPVMAGIVNGDNIRLLGKEALLWSQNAHLKIRRPSIFRCFGCCYVEMVLFLVFLFTSILFYFFKLKKKILLIYF